MIDSKQLLETARSLLAIPADGPASEAYIRRGVSTAYYAVFHHVLRLAADHFVGSDKRAQSSYELFYRGFSHARVAEVCKKLDRPKLPDALAEQLNRSSVSSELRDFMNAFVTLQELRDIADYRVVDDGIRDLVGWLLSARPSRQCVQSMTPTSPRSRTFVR